MPITLPTFHLPDSLEELLIIAGLSGAGRSTALHAAADLGFNEIDNLPLPLFSKLISLFKESPEHYKRTVLAFDTNSPEEVSSLAEFITNHRSDSRVRLLFIDATTDVVLRRYSETRRRHPRFSETCDHSLQDTINRERALLAPLRERADTVIDSTTTTIHDLRREVTHFVGELQKTPSTKLRITILSFGFKYGLPRDADLCLDVRFLPNPHFVEKLRPQTGLSAPVSDYVMQSQGATELLEKYTSLLNFLIPNYEFEGKSYLTVAIGCTGGKHRSVAFAEAIKAALQIEEGRMTTVKHRDLER